MTQIKKFAWSSVAAAFAMVVALSMVVSTAHADGSVTTTGTTAVALNTNLATGSGAFTALGTSPVSTMTAAGVIGETYVVTAPAGFQFQDVGAVVVGGTGTAVLNAGALSSNNSVITFTETTAHAIGDTFTHNSLEVRPIFANTVGGTITVSGTGGITGTAQTLTVTARPTPFTFAFVATPNTTTIAADGSQTVSFAVTVTDGGAVTVNNTPVNFTAALGGFGTTGAQTTTINTNNVGVATVVYKGLGTAGTDTIIAEAAGQVGTQNMTLQTVAPAAGTPTTLTGSANRLAIAPTASTLTPAYTSPNTTSTVTFRETDAAGTGVNGRQIVISTNVGRIAAVGGCTSASGTSVVVTTATVGGVAGRAQADVCAAAASQVGDATVTARDVALSSVTGTLALTSAGPAATATTTWNNGILTVTVKDAAGRNVADGTGIQVTLPANVGAVSPNADTATVNGQVQFAIALTEPTGNAVITVRDAVAGTIRLNTAVNVTTSTTPTPGEGDGSLSTPNFGSGNVGSAVFDGGTIEELSAAVTAAGGTAVWVQGTDGNWYRYNTLATGATAFVNNAFNAQFADGLDQTAVFVVK